MKDQLNKLLRINIDAQNGYAFAAAHIENENFRNFLQSYARQREKYANEIEAELLDQGFESDRNTTFLGDIHQAVLKIKEEFAPSHDDAIISECTRGESEAIETYKKVLKSNELGKKQLQLVMTHYDNIRAAKSTLEKIRTVI